MKYINNNTFTMELGASTRFLRTLGIQDIDSFLYKPKPKDYENPWDLDNLKQLIDVLHTDIMQHKTFFLQVDSDTDGMTSSAIFYNYFKELYPDIKILYRVHDGKEHGVIVDTVPVEADVIVIPDAGSNQLEEQEVLANQGRDVLIIDHHIVNESCKYNRVIIVNNQSSSKFLNKQLSGAGMVFKVIEAYDMMFGTGNGYRKYEDLAALGIIADCMDSRTLDNNAIILNGLTHIYNPMFMALLEKQGGGGFRIKDITNPTKLDVAFYIAPLINAVIRSGTIDDKRQLFEGFIGVGANQTFDSTWRGKERHESFYEFVARNAINLRGRQNRIKDKSMEAIEEIVQKENLLQNKVLIIKVSAELVSKNITGLVAMDAVNTYGKPTLVVRPVVETTNGKQVVFYRGSGRAPVVPGFNNFMAVLQESGLMDYVEGHENAFGVSIAEDRIDDLTAFLNKRLATIDFDNKLEMVDCCVNDDNWNVLVLKEFGSLEHIYGNGIPEPKFHFEFSARDIDFRIQGQHEDSLKISHDGITLIAFHCVPLIESYKKICTEYPNNELKVEVIGTASINTWNGYDNVQIIIKEAELSVSDIVVQKPANMSMLF